MNRTIHFITGLPRSGSTLLCNILNQNPSFHATSTSGVVDFMVRIRNQWDDIIAFRASPDHAIKEKEAVLKGVLPSYYSIVDKPVIFDKNRGWMPHIEMAEFALGRPVKMIATVREIVDILASFENLYRENIHIWQFPQQKTNATSWQTVEDRADLWMSNEQPIGAAYNVLADAFHRGLRDRFHIIEFADLTQRPEVTMKKLYDFIGEDYFLHDFKRVEQTTHEDDLVHGIPMLHKIRQEVKPMASNAKELLGEETWKRYQGVEFWRTDTPVKK